MACYFLLFPQVTGAKAVVKLVVRGGVEPPTFRFSGGRSYQLSYLTMSGPATPDCGWCRPERS